MYITQLSGQFLEFPGLMWIIVHNLITKKIIYHDYNPLEYQQPREFAEKHFLFHRIFLAPCISFPRLSSENRLRSVEQRWRSQRFSVHHSYLTMNLIGSF